MKFVSTTGPGKRRDRHAPRPPALRFIAQRRPSGRPSRLPLLVVLWPLLVLSGITTPIRIDAAPPAEAEAEDAAETDSSVESEQLALVMELVATSDDEQLCLDLLRGVRVGLQAGRQVPMPAGWQQVHERLGNHSSGELRQLVQELALIFGQQEAIDALLDTAKDDSAPLDRRRAAVATLVQALRPETIPLLLELLDEAALRVDAARGLAAYNDNRIAPALLAAHGRWPAEQADHLIHALAARADSAHQLLRAIESGKIPRRAVTAVTARQIAALGADVERRLREVWGESRPTDADKQAVIAAHRKQLTPERLASADATRGRVVFERTCKKCHRLFGEGEQIGPDLTGTNRVDLTYLLENIVDPNSLVGRDYQMTIFTLVDGRVISGIVRMEDSSSVQIQTPNETIVLDVHDIESRDRSTMSLMPEGQLNDLSADEIADLIAYLQHPTQVHLPPPE